MPPIIMNSKPSPLFAILLLALLWCKGASTVAGGCIESERNALLDFKRGLRDHTGRLSSWNGSDCCNWQGVACSNRTGHVVRLDLRNPHPPLYDTDYSPPLYDIDYSPTLDDTDYASYMWWPMVGEQQPKPFYNWSMGGELRPSLLALKKLRYLDLSMNDFGGRPIPEFFGSIRNLRYLNLSLAGFGGLVPRQIGNLSSLQYLDLYNHPYFILSDQVPELSIDDPLWISCLSSLQHLGMGGVKFRDTSGLLESLNMLPHIEEVQLSRCNIQSIPLSLPHVNFTRLSTLDLSDNWINSTIPSWLFNVSSLVHLDLSLNRFRDTSSLVESLNMLPHIVEVHLSMCGIQSIPLSLPHVNFTRLSTLDLSDNRINSTIPSWLFNVSSLVHLDFSWNDFRGSIPADIENLSSLNVLDLSFNMNLQGPIPKELGNICKLQTLGLRNMNMMSMILSLPHVNFTRLSTLDLSGNSINSTIPSWLFNLSSLVHLDLSWNDFRGSIPADIENLSSLEVLDLSYNFNLQGVIPTEVGNICKLQTLGLTNTNISRSLPELGDVFSGCIKTSLENLWLSGTGLTGYLPDWLGELRSLKSLSLGYNSLVGSLPESLLRLTSLRGLYLSNNKLNGTIPESLGGLVELVSLDLSMNRLEDIISEAHLANLTKLVYLDVSKNLLEGNISEAHLANLTKLVHLDLSKNLLEGIISEAHLANLTKLWYLDLSSNRLALKFSPNWVPLFRLYSLDVSSCSLGKKFPSWIRNQANISVLRMANAGIEDAMPDWFWVLVVQVRELDISENAISGRFPDFFSFVNLERLILRSNYFYGSLPTNFSAFALDLSDNLFSGMIDPAIGERMPYLLHLSLSGNKLHGDVPSSLCQLQDVAIIDLARNFLSGELPNCWKDFLLGGYYLILDFSSNNLSGGIPDTIGSLSSLEALNLSNNSLSGEIPTSLHGCTRLAVLDLSQNKFTGKVPAWIGESYQSLKILRLRSNMFIGRIPRNLPRLVGLQIVDLAHNNLSGTIPKSFGNFAVMKVMRAHRQHVLRYYKEGYVESLEVFMKGRALMYGDFNAILSLVTDLDLSRNNLYGAIPRELGKLGGLMSLNLSGNHLNGEIPKEVGSMHSLESLDLSGNELSGAIPSTMAYLTSLNYLDLSSNNLSGRIPSGNQLLTFNESTYIGNPGLCGFPLKQICEDDNSAGTRNSTTLEDDDGTGSEMWWRYLGAAPGFVVGFWVFWGTLMLKRNWKDAYFRFMDRQYDRFYVIVAVSFNRFKNRYV